jgi:hypothetical protein
MDFNFELVHDDKGYFDDPAYSQSDLKAVLDCPQLLWEMKHNGGRRKLPTAAMQSGTIDHMAVLEPDRFDKTYAVCGPRNTKAGKAAAKAAEDAGLEPITQAQYVEAHNVNAAIRQHPLAKQLLVDGQPEVSVYGEDASTGLKVKGKLDWFNDDRIIDLKTVGPGGASPAAFTKQIVNFKYHLQAAHYLEMTGAEAFIFLVVEREPPYQIGIYELDDNALAEGRWLRKKALDTVAFCRAANSWPGYTPNQPQTLSLPSWGFDS